MRLTEKELETIINELKKDTYSKTQDISDYLLANYNLKIDRRKISEINIGRIYKQKNVEYPINNIYANIKMEDKKCSVCNGQGFAIFKDHAIYCKKHYLQISRKGKISERTIYDKNDIIKYDKYAEIILRDKNGNERARTKIDLEDVDSVSKYKWYLMCNGKRYVQGTLEKGVKVRLHRFILGLNNFDPHDINFVADHINGDSLDNRRSNLRIVTQHENAMNMRPWNDMRGIHKYKVKDGYHYQAHITYNFEPIYLGSFKTLEEAKQARRNAEKKYGFLINVNKED